MKKSYHTIVALPFLAMLVSSLAGCGNKRNNYAYDLDFNVDVSGTKIQFWAGFGSNITGTLTKLLDEFHRLTGVTVEYESKSSYDGCLKAVTGMVTSGQYPHVVVGYPDHFSNYVKSDIIVRLDYYLENDVHNSTFEPDGVDFKLSDFYSDYIVENQSVEFDADGKPYTLGIPFNKSTEMLVYNKTFFNYCASRDDLKTQIYVPETYDQLESVGKAILKFLEDNDVYNHVLYDNGTTTKTEGSEAVLDLTDVFGPTYSDSKKRFKPFSYDSQANLFITNVRQNGGTYTELLDKQNRKGYLAFDSAETRTGLTQLKKLYDENVFGIPADWGEAKYGSNPFKASKTVMTLGSSAGVANDAATGNKFAIGCAPVPYVNASRKYVISQGANLALLDRGSREERVAAWQLIKFLTKYANGYFCKETGYFPTCAYAEQAGADGTSGMWKGYETQEDFVDEDYATWLAESDVSFNLVDQIKADAAKTNLNKYTKESEGWIKFVDPPFPGSADIREAVASIPPWVFTGQRTIDQAISETYQKLSDYVRS